MTYFNTKKFTYLAIDESPIGGNCSNLVIVGAESKNNYLAKQSSFLPKAADYLKKKKIGLITERHIFFFLR